MPTQHLFRETDLEVLENKPPLGKFKILVVGTFNGNIEGNTANWFYGRPENDFWYLFPQMLGIQSLHPSHRKESMNDLILIWKKFCIENKIYIVDLFKDVSVNLKTHSDKNLHNLSPNEYTLFNFKKSFSNCTFDFIMFTWKGQVKNTLTSIKKEYEIFFSQKNSKVIHLVTPSRAYRKSRDFKLKQWKFEYGK